MKASLRSITLFLSILLFIGLFYGCREGTKDTKVSTLKSHKIVINEAARTLLYLPLYHAKEGGFFERNGLDVTIVTGGTATNAFAAMTSGEAQFAQADPMYVPISNEKRAETRVVAQVVSKIAVWGLTMDSAVNEINSESLLGERISTHVRPMTAYTYSIKAVEDLGLIPGQDVQIIQNSPGNELNPMLLGQAKFAMTLEPSVSIAVSQGAKVVMSFPKILGEQMFTALMAKQEYIESNRDVVLLVLKSYQEALNNIYADRNAALRTSVLTFPQVKREIIEMALDRILSEEVIPRSISISEESWEKAVAVRLKAGDLKEIASIKENVRIDLINEALGKVE